jgi:hypothetical protein
MRNKQSKRRTAACPCILSWRSILHVWHSQTPYGKDTDFVFPSLKAEGCVPLSPSAFVADHLRKAAEAAGVQIQDGQRFGLPAEP